MSDLGGTMSALSSFVQQSSLVSAFLGAVVGGTFTLAATLITDYLQRKKDYANMEGMIELILFEVNAIDAEFNDVITHIITEWEVMKKSGVPYFYGSHIVYSKDINNIYKSNLSVISISNDKNLLELICHFHHYFSMFLNSLEANYKRLEFKSSEIDKLISRQALPAEVKAAIIEEDEALSLFFENNLGPSASKARKSMLELKEYAGTRLPANG